MIFEELGRIKRQFIMSSIILMALGIIMIICPDEYILTMIGTMGSILLVFAILGVLEYLDSTKSLMDYVKLTISLIIGIVGTAVLVFQIHSMYAVSFLFGVFLILSGVSYIFNAEIYAKRSGHDGWWMMIIFSAILVLCGLIILIHPFWDSVEGLFKAVGGMMMYSSLLSIMHLIWIWPVKSE